MQPPIFKINVNDTQQHIIKNRISIQHIDKTSFKIETDETQNANKPSIHSAKCYQYIFISQTMGPKLYKLMLRTWVLVVQAGAQYASLPCVAAQALPAPASSNVQPVP